MRAVRATIAGLVVLLLSVVSSASARRWTTVTGQIFEADLARIEGATVVLTANGKEYRYPIANLSVPDRLFVNRTAYLQSRGAAAATATTAAGPSAQPIASVPSPAEKSSPLQLNGQTLTTGSRNEIEVPITDTSALRTVKTSYGKPSTKAKMLLVLPDHFDPVGKVYPVLIVSSTTDGAGSSPGSAKANYLPEATNQGYVVMAVDGEFGKPASGDDSTDFRQAAVSSGLSAINQEWPQSKSWPIVTAGVSGGGGYASHQAMMLIQKQAPLIGLLLAVTRWDPTDFPNVLQRTPFVPLHNLPIFISAGENDPIATKDVTDRMHQDVTRQGFRKVRFEHFSGGHTLNRQHLQTALDWFREESEEDQRRPEIIKRMRLLKVPTDAKFRNLEFGFLASVRVFSGHPAPACPPRV